MRCFPETKSDEAGEEVGKIVIRVPAQNAQKIQLGDRSKIEGDIANAARSLGFSDIYFQVSFLDS